jgi:hypothetical protein
VISRATLLQISCDPAQRDLLQNSDTARINKKLSDYGKNTQQKSTGIHEQKGHFCSAGGNDQKTV